MSGGIHPEQGPLRGCKAYHRTDLDLSIPLRYLRIGLLPHTPLSLPGWCPLSSPRRALFLPSSKKKLDTISELMTREIVISDPIFRNNYLNSYTAFRYSTDYFMTIKIVISRKEFFSGVVFENNRPVIFVITTRNRFITTVEKTLKTKITKNFRSIYTLSLFSLLLSFIFIIIIILLFYYLRHYLIYSAPLERVVSVVSAGYIS